MPLLARVVYVTCPMMCTKISKFRPTQRFSPYALCYWTYRAPYDMLYISCMRLSLLNLFLGHSSINHGGISPSSSSPIRACAV